MPSELGEGEEIISWEAFESLYHRNTGETPEGKVRSGVSCAISPWQISSVTGLESIVIPGLFVRVNKFDAMV